MTNQDEPRFKAVMLALAETFDKTPSDLFLGLYWQALDDLTAVEFEAAAVKAIRELKFFPKPAELREFAGKRRPRQLWPVPADVAEERVRRG